MMDTRKKADKTFFSHWGASILSGGMLILCGIVAFISAALKPGAGISGLVQNGSGYVYALPVLLGVIFCCFFSWRVRFEETYATIYYCTFFPVRIYYTEVIRLTYFFQKYKKQEVPVSIYFHQSSGTVKIWNFAIFSPKTAAAIKSELESRINLPENQREIPDVDSWANSVLRSSIAEKITWAAFAIIMFAIGTWEMAKQLEWNKRIRTWDKVDGIILKNTTKWVSRGKRSKKVADVEYKYICKGKTYYGTRIVYDSDTFPDLKVGKKRQVIVDPEKPQECAIMFWYRGNWGFVRYIKCLFCYLVSLWLAALFCRAHFRKKIRVPYALKSYINSIPVGRFYSALEMEQAPAAQNNIELRQKMEYLQNFRYGVIGRNGSKSAWRLPGGSRMTVFDFQEKKFFSCKNFRPEKRQKIKSFSFSEVDHLCCSVSVGRSGKFAGVFAVTHDGSKLPLFKVAWKRFELMLELLPELAEKMGHLPITY